MGGERSGEGVETLGGGNEEKMHDLHGIGCGIGVGSCMKHWSLAPGNEIQTEDMEAIDRSWVPELRYAMLCQIT